ncbi:MAG: flap endonuclease-1 [Candidatus Caldarchaeum sp.]|nr:flap endonuclease-1 [Candidatus Caldarchaeum sp.]MCS7136751.1 flap endonuclease-1 [Candidatus Caldarchaeum sp.]MDW7978823.1 flap endonuclease-1 [Candidatus Caldarchaeum sp.]MDW8359354.1 flap endonuclease-1 [Candidatus Caldarchaeum sp.]
MGVKLGDIIPETAVEKTSLKKLSGRSIAIDAYNILYQFIATIRGPDGRALMDRRGRVTSHLSGLFFRTVNFLQEGLKPVYVFDGRPPEMKRETVERRASARREAGKMYAEALESGDLDAARRYAQRAASLERYMVESAVDLLKAMGVPCVMAPAEGEAQAAYMAAKGSVYASGSQDMDSLLFGSPRLVRNLSIVGRRKLPRRNEYVEVEPEIIHLDKLLADLGISRDQLIDVGLLVGTDYSPQVRGVGPKTALKIVKEHGSLEKAVEAGVVEVDFDYEAVRQLFRSPQVSDDYRVEFRDLSEERVVELLVEEFDFSRERVKKALEELRQAAVRKSTSLDEFFS